MQQAIFERLYANKDETNESHILRASKSATSSSSSSAIATKAAIVVPIPVGSPAGSSKNQDAAPAAPRSDNEFLEHVKKMFKDGSLVEESIVKTQVIKSNYIWMYVSYPQIAKLYDF